MKSKMMVPNYIDDDSDKYGSKKKMNSTGMLSLRLRRQVSSTVLYLQREKKFLLRIIITLSLLIGVLVIQKRRGNKIKVNVELNYTTESDNFEENKGNHAVKRAIEDELERLGLGDQQSFYNHGELTVEEKSENINDEMLRGQETPDVSGSNLNNNDGNTLNIEEEHAKDHDIETNGEDFINTSSNKPLIELSEKELFSNWKELEDCGKISVPPFYRRPSNWHALKAYTTLYTQSPIYACVPKLRPHLQLTVEAFVQLFRKVAQPVLFSFENLRSLGFEMHPFTLEELSEIFPFDPVKDKKITYSANGKVNSEYLELGPAVHAFKEDQKLIKTKGGQRSFPRNMKVKPIALSKLGVQLPPLIKGKSSFQSPSLWFGSSSSPTAFHSDCCDNFVYMLTGIKRFTLAPPTDWQALTPNCIGKRKNLCYATPADPSDMSTPTKKKINRMQVDVAPGQILYLPAGTFHHINNLGATLMTNVWTRSSETLGIISCNREKELVSNK